MVTPLAALLHLNCQKLSRGPLHACGASLHAGIAGLVVHPSHVPLHAGIAGLVGQASALLSLWAEELQGEKAAQRVEVQSRARYKGQ